MESGTFRLEIELGNDDAQTAEDVARLLRDVAKRLDRFGLDDEQHNIRDGNGNTIGFFGIEEG